MYYPRHSEVRQKTRKYAPSDLLPIIAAKASKQGTFDFPDNWIQTPPWALAAIARDSVLFGNEYRSEPVTEEALDEIVHAFNLSHDDDPNDLRIASVIPAYLYEQLPYRGGIKWELARSYLLMVETARATKGFNPEWSDVFGGTIEQCIQAAFILQVIAECNDGVINKKILKSDGWEFCSQLLPVEITQKFLDQLTATPDEMKADFGSLDELPSYFQRRIYNPLSRTPFIDLGGESLICPQPRLVLATMTPESLYYAGVREWGDKFSSQLGYWVESYVGRLLAGIEGADLSREVKWGPKKARVDSIDWFVVTDNIVILVECKSAFLNLGARVGDITAWEKASKVYLAKARMQIQSTYQGILEGDSAFHSIPGPDRRKYFGITVTGGPFHAANFKSSLYQVLPQIQIPVLTASLSDMEMLTSLSVDELEAFLELVHQKGEISTFSIKESLRSISVNDDLIREHPLITEITDKLFTNFDSLECM